MYANSQAKGSCGRSRPGDPGPSPEALAALADLADLAARFRALSEPTRLRLLQQLCAGEASVGALARATGCSPANVSRHLSVLQRQGWVACRRQGREVRCRLADDQSVAWCARVGAALQRRQRQAEARARAWWSPPPGGG